jgi:sulfite exporter TauE/SafE
MFIFGLGTVPLMTIIVYVGNFANGLVRKRIQQVIPYVVVFIGVLFIIRGLGLGIPYVSPLPVTDLATSIEGCH